MVTPMSGAFTKVVRTMVIGAALVAIAPASALACSRSVSPDPVGISGADFFSYRIVEAAATVDVVLAEGSRPRVAIHPDLMAQATVFRVVERLKGGSPDRFTLLTAKPLRTTSARNLQPQLYIDGEGRVIPDTWLKEAPWDEKRLLTSCAAGYINPEPGKLYLVARDEAGRLLDKIQIYQGDHAMEAFSFIPADLPSEGPWHDAFTYAASEQLRNPRYKEDEVEPVADDGMATAVFKRPLDAAAVAAILAKTQAIPFAVRVSAGKFVDEARVPLTLASATLLKDSVDQAHANLDAISDVRLPAAEALDRYQPIQFDNHGGVIRGGHALIEAEDRLAAAKAAGVQGIISVELTGDPAAWDALRKDPSVEQVMTGARIGGRRYAPAITTGEPKFTWDGIKGAALIAKLHELARR